MTRHQTASPAATTPPAAGEATSAGTGARARGAPVPMLTDLRNLPAEALIIRSCDLTRHPVSDLRDNGAGKKRT